jgi:hypothetical protein
MVKLGTKLTEKDNQIAALQSTNAGLVADVQTCHDTPCPPQSGPAGGGMGASGGLIVFLVGLACGMGAAFGVLWMVSK